MGAKQKLFVRENVRLDHVRGEVEDCDVMNNLSAPPSPPTPLDFIHFDISLPLYMLLLLASV